MLCQECRKKPATVHITRIINGRKTELNLCSECAGEKGELDFFMEPQFPIQTFLAGLLEKGAMQVMPASAGPRCPGCGSTFRDFSRTGRLGCSQCYEHFGNRLDPVLRRVHGSLVHSGKVPARSGEAIKVRRSIEELRSELARAVEAEEFEKAAKLRDRIKDLQKELG